MEFNSGLKGLKLHFPSGS